MLVFAVAVRFPNPMLPLASPFSQPPPRPSTLDAQLANRMPHITHAQGVVCAAALMGAAANGAVFDLNTPWKLEAASGTAASNFAKY